MIRGGAEVITEIECTINVILLNHPKPFPYLVYGKTVFHETSPWCQNVWGLLLKDKPGGVRQDTPGGVRQDTPGGVTQHKPGWGKTG